MTLARSAVQLLGVYYMDNANALGRDYVWNLLRGGGRGGSSMLQRSWVLLAPANFETSE